MSGRLAAAPAPRVQDVTQELAGRLDRVARRIAESGTRTERSTLEALADVTRATAPGASAALVDWAGAEVARLRAYGVLHGVVLHTLGGDDRGRLLARLEGVAAEPAARVA